MLKFLNKPEWQATINIFFLMAVVRTICAYINPEAFLTYMHVALTEGLILAIVIGQLFVRLHSLEKSRPIVFYACMASSFFVTQFICEFTAQTLINGRFNFIYFFPAHLAVVGFILIVGIIAHNKRKYRIKEDNS